MTRDALPGRLPLRQRVRQGYGFQVKTTCCSSFESAW
jgi:hypothetical protein